MRTPFYALLGLALLGCDDDPGRTLQPITDLAPRLDATLDQGPPVDAQPDAQLDGDTPDATDGATTDGDASDAADLAIDLAVDAGPMAPPGPPDFDEASAVRLNDTLWVIWRAGAEVHGATVDADGALTPFEPEGAPLDTPPAVPTRVEAHLAGHVPYAVIGLETGPIRVRALDVPDAPVLTLDLVGEPRASGVTDGARSSLLVIGLNADGQVAVQVVREGEDGSTLEAPRTLGLGLEHDLPDSVDPVPTGVVLRYADPGQCVRLSASGDSPASFPCRLGYGRVLGTTVGHPLLLYTEAENRVERYVVGALFGASGNIEVLQAYAGAPVFATAAAAVPIVGEVLSGEQIGRYQLALAERDQLWLTDDTWDAWPYENARLVVRQGPLGVVLRFNDAGEVHATVLPLSERTFGGPPYGIERDAVCVPRPESCDRQDQDCDGAADNGRCCATPTLRGSEIPLDEGVEVVQVLASDVQIDIAWHVALKLRDGDEDLGWSGWRIPQGVHVGNRPSAINAFPSAGPERGARFISVGEYNALIGFDAAGHLGVWWSHPEADPTDGVPRAPDDLDAPDPEGVQAGQGRGPCADYLDADGVPGGDGIADPPPPGADANWPILAVEPVAHNGRDTALLLVCPRRIIRLYPFDRAPEYIPFPQSSPVLWATLSPRETDFVLHTTFLSSVSGWLMDAYAYDPARGTMQAQELPPALLNDARIETMGHPIWAGTNEALPWVQIRRDALGLQDVRVLPHPKRDPWKTIRFGALEDAAFAVRRATLIGTRRFCPDGADPCPTRGFWVADLSNGDSVNLWSQSPTFTLPDDGLRWAVVDGNAPLAVFRRVADGFEVLTQRVICQR
jgi:hypothetical protein